MFLSKIKMKNITIKIPRLSPEKNPPKTKSTRLNSALRCHALFYAMRCDMISAVACRRFESSSTQMRVNLTRAFGRKHTKILKKKYYILESCNREQMCVFKFCSIFLP